MSNNEAEIKRLRSIKEYNEKKLLNKNYKLKQQLELTEKALELACEDLMDDVYSRCYICKYYVDNKCIATLTGNPCVSDKIFTRELVKQFKTNAKEMMKSE